jgi:hypothetical protein
LLDLAGRRLGREALRVALPDVVDAVWRAVSVTVLAPPAALRPALGRACWRPAVVDGA